MRNMAKANPAIFLPLFICLLTISCAVVESGGALAKQTGQMLEEMGQERGDSFLGKSMSIGGKVYKSFGASVEKMAAKSQGKSVSSQGKLLAKNSRGTRVSGSAKSGSHFGVGKIYGKCPLHPHIATKDGGSHYEGYPLGTPTAQLRARLLGFYPTDMEVRVRDPGHDRGRNARLCALFLYRLDANAGGQRGDDRASPEHRL